MNDRCTFQHSFGGGFVCTVIFDPKVHYDPSNRTIRPAKEWNPYPKDEDFEAFYPQYMEWMHFVNSELSKIAGQDHTFVFQDKYAPKPYWEFWVYHANGEKKCVAKQYGVFDPRLIGR